MLFTIGYEKATLEHFIGTLQKADIDILVDVRDRAQSRRKGFSKTALSNALGEHGIEYLHLRVLGDPKEGREAARSGDWAEFHRIYGAVIEQPEAIDALDSIAKLVDRKKVCLMCYERDYSECHRALVSDRLFDERNLQSQHLGVQAFEPVRRVCDNNQGAAA